MSELPKLTLLIGPQTRLALSLNDLARTARAPLHRAGLTALPNRVGTPLVRRSLDPGSHVEAAGADLEDLVAKGPVFVSAISLLGPPKTGLHQGEMFPGAEAVLSRFGVLPVPPRIIFCPDTLPEFFLAAQSEVLEKRVRRHDWATLFELSWTDLAREILAASPGSELLVLTAAGASINSPQVLQRIFGPAASAIPDRFALMKAAVSQTGVAVLDRMLGDGVPDEAMLSELYHSFAVQSSHEEIAERLGMDRVTVTLLNQRLDEDLVAISALPQVEIV